MSDLKGAKSFPVGRVQCHRPIWECTHQLHDAIVRAIAIQPPQPT